MTRVSCTIVHNDSFQLEKVVLLVDLSVVDDELVFIEIIFCQTLFIHLFEQLIPRDHFLAVWTHVKVHRELHVVINFELRHGVIVELKAFETQK